MHVWMKVMPCTQPVRRDACLGNTVNLVQVHTILQVGKNICKKTQVKGICSCQSIKRHLRTRPVHSAFSSLDTPDYPLSQQSWKTLEFQNVREFMPRVSCSSAVGKGAYRPRALRFKVLGRNLRLGQRNSPSVVGAEYAVVSSIIHKSRSRGEFHKRIGLWTGSRLLW